MRKLSKEQLETRDRIAVELAVLHGSLSEAVEKFKVKLVEAQEFCAAVAGEIDSHISSKSEKWQESETGQAFSEWKDSWEMVEFAEPDVPTEDPAEVLLCLDTEPNT